MSYSLNQNYGCLECSWDKLRRWALRNHIISDLDGPEEMANRIMQLTARMEDRIQLLQSKLEER